MCVQMQSCHIRYDRINNTDVMFGSVAVLVVHLVVFYLCSQQFSLFVQCSQLKHLTIPPFRAILSNKILFFTIFQVFCSLFLLSSDQENLLRHKKKKTNKSWKFCKGEWKWRAFYYLFSIFPILMFRTNDSVDFINLLIIQWIHKTVAPMWHCTHNVTKKKTLFRTVLHCIGKFLIQIWIPFVRRTNINSVSLLVYLLPFLFVAVVENTQLNMELS